MLCVFHSGCLAVCLFWLLSCVFFSLCSLDELAGWALIVMFLRWVVMVVVCGFCFGYCGGFDVLIV